MQGQLNVFHIIKDLWSATALSKVIKTCSTILETECHIHLASTIMLWLKSDNSCQRTVCLMFTLTHQMSECNWYVCAFPWIWYADINYHRHPLYTHQTKILNNKPPTLHFTSWKIRTLCPVLSNNLHQVEDSRKMAIIKREPKRMSNDITGLQETRLPSNGNLREQDYMFVWQGKEPEDQCIHGVRFAVRNSLLSLAESPWNGSPQIFSLHFSILSGPVSILSVYVHQLKQMMCSMMSSTLSFEASVHAWRLQCSSWIRPRLLAVLATLALANWMRMELFSYHNLYIMSTFFANKPRHRVS